MILLDTHVLIWWVDDKNKLPKIVSKKIDEAIQKNRVFVSAFSFWEIAMLYKRKRLFINSELGDWVEEIKNIKGLSLVPVSDEILIDSVNLEEPFHADPADRIIVATARSLNATLYSKDQKILNYSYVSSFWPE